MDISSFLKVYALLIRIKKHRSVFYHFLVFSFYLTTAIFIFHVLRNVSDLIIFLTVLHRAPERTMKADVYHFVLFFLGCCYFISFIKGCLMDFLLFRSKYFYLFSCKRRWSCLAVGVFQLIWEPVQPFVEAIAARSTGGLNVPASVSTKTRRKEEKDMSCRTWSVGKRQNFQKGCHYCQLAQQFSMLSGWRESALCLLQSLQ